MVPGRPFRATLVVSADNFPEIDGSSAAIRALKRDMLYVARDPHVTVLIVGESGTGKERIAQAIHRASPRGHAPFVVVDCAGLSATLAEDTLFGHVRGAFTGAIEERAGPFERADGGTVLLDEIGELPLELQMKLLRALQSRTIQRLGARQETAFDVRIIAATHVDLAAAVIRGRFREDLYYRLKVYEIAVPPLRRRGADDIRALAGTILNRLAGRRGREAPALDPEILKWLADNPWPGNVRELENALERMLVAAGGEPLLHAGHLRGRSAAIRSAPAPPRANPPTADRILDALRRNGIKYGRTAADLGLSRHQLYRLVRRYGIQAKAGDP
jgi:transcriptional regulator with GAF, ATPase, and Fis domain